jgi:Family of unknown function (DUF6152)
VAPHILGIKGVVRIRVQSKWPNCLILAGLLLTICGLAFAHHGSAMYVKKALVLKDATVTKFMWQNPHTLVLFDAKDDKGNVIHWAGEAGSAGSIRLLGWNKYSLMPGDVITVYIWPSKFDAAAGRLEKIVLDDGRVLKDSDREDRGDINRY